jgi:polyhydroxybutyrate depolymerase
MLGLIVAACHPHLPPDRISGLQTFRRSLEIEFDGLRRTYLVHVPTRYVADTPLPLVVVVHGAFDSAAGIEKVSGFSRLADRENFIVLYPNGIGRLGFFQHWNAGHCCGRAAAEKIDDVGFLAAAIEDLQRRLSVDRDRIYMTGFSNGGMLTYRFAAERGDLLAAAAPMAAIIGGTAGEGERPLRIADPREPVPLRVIHGLNDEDIRYEGGASLARGGTRTFLSVEDSVDFWVKHNRCHGQVGEEDLFSGAVRRRTWAGCRANADVQLYLINGWGHLWPGGEFTRSLPENDPLRDFDAAEIAWEFFSAHRKH